MRTRQQLLGHSLFCAQSSSWLVLLYKAEAAVQATLMHVMLYNTVCAPAQCASIMVYP